MQGGKTMEDKYGRKIDYVRVSLTDQCNLRCIYCMPEDICDFNKNEKMSLEDVIKAIKVFASLGIKKVRYTGGEPLVVKNIDKLIADTAAIVGIEDIAITTNGVLLGNMAETLKLSGLKRVNISLDTF